ELRNARRREKYAERKRAFAATSRGMSRAEAARLGPLPPVNKSAITRALQKLDREYKTQNMGKGCGRSKNWEWIMDGKADIMYRFMFDYKTDRFLTNKKVTRELLKIGSESVSKCRKMALERAKKQRREEAGSSEREEESGSDSGSESGNESGSESGSESESESESESDSLEERTHVDMKAVRLALKELKAEDGYTRYQVAAVKRQILIDHFFCEKSNDFIGEKKVMRDTLKCGRQTIMAALRIAQMDLAKKKKQKQKEREAQLAGEGEGAALTPYQVRVQSRERRLAARKERDRKRDEHKARHDQAREARLKQRHARQAKAEKGDSKESEEGETDRERESGKVEGGKERERLSMRARRRDVANRLARLPNGKFVKGQSKASPSPSGSERERDVSMSEGSESLSPSPSGSEGERERETEGESVLEVPVSALTPTAVLAKGTRIPLPNQGDSDISGGEGEGEREGEGDPKSTRKEKERLRRLEQKAEDSNRYAWRRQRAEAARAEREERLARQAAEEERRERLELEYSMRPVAPKGSEQAKREKERERKEKGDKKAKWPLSFEDATESKDRDLETPVDSPSSVQVPALSDEYFRQAASAVAFLHDKDIAHRDIKPENILLQGDKTVRLCDFGTAVFLRDSEPPPMADPLLAATETSFLTETAGTIAFMAPEIFDLQPGQVYAPRPTDVWSLGATLYYMLFGEEPFLADSMKDLRDLIAKGMSPEHSAIKLVRTDVCPTLADLLCCMLQPDAGDRLTMKDVLNHPWFVCDCSSCSEAQNQGRTQSNARAKQALKSSRQLRDYHFKVNLNRRQSVVRTHRTHIRRASFDGTEQGGDGAGGSDTEVQQQQGHKASDKVMLTPRYGRKRVVGLNDSDRETASAEVPKLKHSNSAADLKGTFGLGGSVSQASRLQSRLDTLMPKNMPSAGPNQKPPRPIGQSPSDNPLTLSQIDGSKSTPQYGDSLVASSASTAKRQ
ncbi:hypothetical protein KIPB_007194, partial [Kipferlia bialata]